LRSIACFLGQTKRIAKKDKSYLEQARIFVYFCDVLGKNSQSSKGSCGNSRLGRYNSPVVFGDPL